MRGIALLLGMLAILAPIVIGPVAHAQLMRASLAASEIGDVPVCHGDTGGSQPDTPRDHREPDCAICPLCVATTHLAMAWTPAPFVPAPSVVARSRPQLPPSARAPPSAYAFAAQPRGPPTLV